jgi:hypothetical protein
MTATISDPTHTSPRLHLPCLPPCLQSFPCRRLNMQSIFTSAQRISLPLLPPKQNHSAKPVIQMRKPRPRHSHSEHAHHRIADDNRLRALNFRLLDIALILHHFLQRTVAQIGDRRLPWFAIGERVDFCRQGRSRVDGRGRSHPFSTR